MDYYRDPESIEAAAAVRRCLALLTKQAQHEPQPKAQPDTSQTSQSDVGAHATQVGSSRPASSRARPVSTPSKLQKETIMQV